MKITVIAKTETTKLPDSVAGTAFEDFYYGDSEALRSDADTLAHFAGRSCYQAWNMPNEATRTNKGYIGNIISQGHFSVLEHASVTFYVEGVSRNLTHELIRHRHLSYSELSQRYVDVSEMDFITPPAFGAEPHKLKGAHLALEDYEYAESELKELGLTGKALRQAARYYLPSGMETRIVVSGNHRAWRDMLYKRYSVHADAEIRELATLILAELRKIAPATYQDFPDSPFE